ncbi:MAG TPA: CarD family transcriptional regulator [Methylocella sp.]
MASVKKTMKSSEIKKAKKPGIRVPKAKASKRIAVSKAKKTVTKPALAAKSSVAKAASKVAAKKVAGKVAAKKPVAKSLAAKALATKQLAARKAAEKAKLKTKRASAAPSRVPAAKNKKMNKNLTKEINKKKTAAAPRSPASKSQPALPAKQVARATAAKRITASKRVAPLKPAATPKTATVKVLRDDAINPPVTARNPVEGKTAAVQKAAAGKDTAAALLAFKQNAARLSESRKRTAAATLSQPAVNNSSKLSPKLSEPTTVIKEVKKVASMKTVSATDTNSARPAANEAAAESPRGESKSTFVPPKDLAKPLVSKAPPAALTPVGSDASQVNMAEARPMEKTSIPASRPTKAANSQRPMFKPGEFVVYPAHGVGQIVVIEEQEVAGFKLELYVISFIKDKMVLKVPTPKAASVGMRKLADASAIKAALDTLAGRARIKRTMWSRRAQEYEAKINSGDLNAIAEVVRDLYRSDTQPEQSYSERQLYEAALDRMTREIVVVEKLTETESLKVIEGQLQKGPRRGKAEDIDPDDAEIEEAA